MKKNCHDCKKPLDSDARYCQTCGVARDVELLRCERCKGPNTRDAKYCKHCGLPIGAIGGSLTGANVTEQAIPHPPKGITVEFPSSRYASFECAVAEAKKFPTFSHLVVGNPSVYRVNCDLDSIMELLPLVVQMKGWIARTVYLDGEKVPWDSVFSFAGCFERKKVSYRPELYCLGYEYTTSQNIWGCMNAHLPFHEHADWFSWGRWLNTKGDWEFDKNKIRDALEKNLFPYRFCPALQLDLVEKVLSLFPDVVNTRTDRDWEIVRSWNINFSPTTAVKYVRPKGPGAMRNLFRKIRMRLPEPNFGKELL